MFSQVHVIPNVGHDLTLYKSKLNLIRHYIMMKIHQKGQQPCAMSKDTKVLFKKLFYQLCSSPLSIAFDLFSICNQKAQIEPLKLGPALQEAIINELPYVRYK